MKNAHTIYTINNLAKQRYRVEVKYVFTVHRYSGFIFLFFFLQPYSRYSSVIRFFKKGK